MPVCPARTVQSIDKDKQKNAGIRRYNTVSRRDVATCCGSQPTCIVPTISSVTAINSQAGVLYSVTITGPQIPVTGSSMPVQWYYFLGGGPDQNNPFPQPLIDNPPSVSGSQTTQLVLNTSFYNGYTIYCSGENPCAPPNTISPIYCTFYKIGCGSYPTAGNITVSNCRSSSDPVYTTRCDYTVHYSNGTTFQWYYASGLFKPFLLVDGPNISGSQTPTISLNTSVLVDACNTTNFYCVVTNSCGSTRSNNSVDVLMGCPQIRFNNGGGGGGGDNTG